MNLAIQLYTVRTSLAQDFRGTLEALLQTGYHAVEFAWIYGGLTPSEQTGCLKSLGLTACGLHATLNELLDAGSHVYACAQALEVRYVTTSCAEQVAGDWDATIRRIGEAASLAKSLGVTLTYHNHAEEFRLLGDRTALEILLDRLDPEIVQAELDVGFAFRRGQDPAGLIRRYGRRLAQVHLRDTASPESEFVEIGTGVLDIAGIWRAAEETGVSWTIVEQSRSTVGEMESVRTSMDNLVRMALAVRPG